MRQLLRFGLVQAGCCLFAALFFVGLGLVRVVPLPPGVDPADALLLWCLGLTFVLWRSGWETGREVAVIFGFHLVGLALELFKVRQGSWSYPHTGLATVGGVPLYSGFMYAAVGSYVCQAWRRLDLRITRYRSWPTAAVAALLYVNFFTSHVLPDLRWALAVLLLVVTRGRGSASPSAGSGTRCRSPCPSCSSARSCGWPRTWPRCCRRGATRRSTTAGRRSTPPSSGRGRCSWW
jgi:uncharacterized membrane protein YoaT (DUF817 family)